jgi:predicted amidophosphoribosyltransferase
MPVVKTDPARLLGPWVEGYVLERQHTLSATFLGTDSFGHERFDTRRSELGELVYRLKNQNDRNAVDAIAETAYTFLQGWSVKFDLIVPVPPSRARAYQPVVEIAAAIAAHASQPMSANCVKKIKQTPELKNVFDYDRRLSLLGDAFEVDVAQIRQCRVR